MADAKLHDFTNLEELEELAKPPVLPVPVYGYYKSGADSESTLKANRDAFARLTLVPRILVDVSRRDAGVTLLGRRLEVPVLVAPMAMMRMAHPDGELAVARGAARAGVPMVQSTMGTVVLEDVRAAGADAPLMLFQLYVLKDRDFTRRLVQRAEACGYHALVVTVDAPYLGNREADVRNGFKLPDGLELANLRGLGQSFKQGEWGSEARTASGFEASFADQVDASLDWSLVPWLRTCCRLPIFVKGVLSPEDARLALDAGVDGIIVSNHGGRQLDCAPAAIDALPAIAAVVNRRVPLLMDGGVRRGTDVLKALALGADAVLLGRPVLYGLALGGQPGVERVLELLTKEICLGLALMGCPSFRHLSAAQVLRAQPSKL